MPLELPSRDPKPLAPGLHRTDAFHRQPLFAVEPAAGASGATPLVRSWGEAHALHGPARLGDVNPAYVAALISGHHSATAAPYRRLRRLPRAHQVLLEADGRVGASPYDPLAGGAAAMEAEQLHGWLRQGLLEHVQRALQGHNGSIGCEHSSGLDSNAVLGALVHGAGLPPERLHTWSQEGGGEGPLLEQLRPFFQLEPEQCHRHQPGREPPQPPRPQPQPLEVFGAPPQIGGNPLATALLAAEGCSLLFSGFGGDQALSHNAVNVPTDLVAQGRWGELLRWLDGSPRRAVKTAGGRMLALGYRPWAVAQVMGRTREFCSSDLLSRALTAEGQAWLSPHLQPKYPWEIDNYLRQHQSIRRRVLADWVAVRAEEETRLAAAHGMAKAFPLLDEGLIATLLQQDPVLFGEGAGRGRLLHRRAFAPFLPPFLRANPTKDREPEGGLEPWRQGLVNQQRIQLERLLADSAAWHPALARHWDLPAIRQESERILSTADPTMKDVLGTTRALATMNAISGWWQALEE